MIPANVKAWACRRPGCAVVIVGDSGPALTFLDRIDDHVSMHRDIDRQREREQLTACHDVVDEWVADQQAAADDVAALAEVVTPSFSQVPSFAPDVLHASPAHARRPVRRHGAGLGVALVLALAVVLALAGLVCAFAGAGTSSSGALLAAGSVLLGGSLALVGLLVASAGRSS